MSDKQSYRRRSWENMRRRARRVFDRKWRASGGEIAAARDAGVSEQVAWHLFFAAFFDGWCDHSEELYRKEALADAG